MHAVPPGRQVANGIKNRVRPNFSIQIRLPEFSRPQKNALQSGLLRAADIGFDAVANHSDFAGRQPVVLWFYIGAFTNT